MMFKLMGCTILFLLCLTLYYKTNKRYHVEATPKEVTQNISIILQTVRRIIVTFFKNTTSTIIQEKDKITTTTSNYIRMYDVHEYCI